MKKGSIAQRTWKTHPTAKYVSATHSQNTLMEMVSKNVSKYPKLICLLLDSNGLGSPSYSLLTTDSSHKMSAPSMALQTIAVRIFLDEFLMHILQSD